MANINNTIKNNLVKTFNTNRDYVRGEISRLGSTEQRNTTYRRNGMLNFGAKQMIGLSDESEFYIIGVGGPPVTAP